MNLKTQLPIVIFYLTAHVGDDGKVDFFDDIYGYDADMQKVLDKGPPYPSQAGARADDDQAGRYGLKIRCCPMLSAESGRTPPISEPDPRPTLRKELLVAVAIIIVLLAYGAWRFPESARADRSALSVSLGALVLYGGVAAWAQRTASARVRMALCSGAKIGLFLGLIEAANHWLEDFADLRSPVPAVLGVGMWAVLFLCFGAVGSLAYRRLGSFRLAALASIWSAMLSTMILVLAACALGLLFMARMQVVLGESLRQAGCRTRVRL